MSNEGNASGGNRQGLRVRSRRGRIGRTWWSERWTGVLESIGLGDRLHRGRSLARAGNVLSLAIEPGEVRAEVSGTRRETHDVRIVMEPIAEGDWKAVEEILSRQALFAARLLSGEMPPPIEEAFAEAGTSLFPSTSDELEAECTCADPARPCPHAAAVFYLMAERFDEDPFLIFLFRGRKGSELLAGLKQRWAHRPPGGAEDPGEHPAAAADGAGAAARPDPAAGSTTPSACTGHPDDGEFPGPAGAGPPPAALVVVPKDSASDPRDPSSDRKDSLAAECFWDARADLDAINPRIAPPVIPEALLRRLGPPPGATEDSLAEAALHKAYRIASSWALRLATRDVGTEE